jgi:tetratricopeptide (TPR) repeat protein
MSLQGDLSTLDFASLFQNLEGGKKSGLLTIESPQGETKLYFHHGKVALLTYPGRPTFEAILLAARAVTPQKLENAKKKKRGSKRSLGEVLVGSKAITQKDLATLVAGRITGEVCELINSGGGAFVFTEGPIPRGVFDPEERALGITLPAGPLLLEAARRTDHWAMIRERIPSDSTHYVVARTPRAPSDPGTARMHEQMLPLLDGSRSVTEVIGAFPHRRFEAYQVLADLAESQAIRVAGGAEMNQLVEQLSRHDQERALALLERGLASNPRNLGLLSTKALLSEELGEVEQASEALKIAVHLQLESGQVEEARKGLERLKELGPEDTFVWERSLDLAVQEGRTEDALADGKKLVQLYKGPGLFKKAAAVLERMVELSDGAWEHVRDLAHVRADGGERDAAVKGLETYGARELARERYAFAIEVYEEVLEIDPDRARAKDAIAQIKSGEHARKKALFQKIRSRAILGLCAALALAGLVHEMLARRAYVGVQREVARRGLIEAGHYAQALELYAQMKAEYPWATVSLYDVRRQMDDLAAKLASVPPRPGP